MERGVRIGPYELRDKLGAGGMGEVWRAHRADLERDFALKLLLPGTEDTLTAIARLQREAEAAASLAEHPGIVGVHDVGPMPDGAGVYCAMDLIEGGSLDAIGAHGDMAPAQAAGFVAQAARAVHFAHEHGVLHRDLKPANMMVTADGTVRVTDFGLARFTKADADVTRLTLSGEIVGTPAYMPPEQAKGEGTDARADVYALGATLYELLAGTPPFTGDSVMRVMAQVLRDPPPPIRTVAPNVAPSLEAIVLKCLEKAPSARYPTALALADDLHRFRNGEPTAARPLSALGRARRRLPSRLLWGGVAALLLAGAVVAAWVALRGRSQRAGAQLTTATRQRTNAERARDALDAYQTVQRDAFDALALVVSANGQAVDRDAPWIDEQIARVDAAAARARRRFPDSRSPDAWSGYVRVMIGREDGMPQLRIAARTGGDDPLPRVLLATAGLVLWARQTRLPAALYLRGAIELRELRETEEGAAIRASVQAQVAAMQRSPLWDLMPKDLPARVLLAAANTLFEPDYPRAEAQLQPLLDEPLTGATAQHLTNLAIFMQGDFERAARSWDAGHRIGNLWATLHAAEAWAAHGTTLGRDRESAIPVFEHAMERATVLLDHGALALVGRKVRAVAASQVTNLTADPARRRQLALQAIDDLTVLAGRFPTEPSHPRNRAGMHWLLTRDTTRPLSERLQAIHAARADLDRAAAGAHDSLVHQNTLAQVEHTLATLAAEQGGDPMPHMQAALSANARARALRPDRAAGSADTGRLLMAAGQYLRETAPARAHTFFEQALPHLDRAVAAGAGGLTARTHRARCHAELMMQRGLPAAERDAHRDAAVADYDRLLAADPLNHEAWQMRSATLVNGGKIPEGLRSLTQALQHFPNDPALTAAKAKVEAFLKRRRGR